jgi:hypothetical protein
MGKFVKNSYFSRVFDEKSVHFTGKPTGRQTKASETYKKALF